MARLSHEAQRVRSINLIKGLETYGDDLRKAISGTKADIEGYGKILQAHIDAADDVPKKYSAYASAVAVMKARENAAHAVATTLEALVRAIFGAANDVKLGAFGMRPTKKPGPKTVAAKLKGQEQGKRTWVLRGTMGKRPRAKAR
jgi:hypothetical protein